MDAEELFQTRIGALLRAGFGADSVRALLGLTGVSEIWPEEDVPWRPAWHLWHEAAAGAYGLELAATAVEAIAGERVAAGWLNLRYYPHPREAAALGFSAEEQRLAASDCFDDTHTPRRGVASRIGPDSFVIGVIELRVAPESDSSALAYSSLDRLSVIGGDAEPPLRAVPGWRLGRPLFDALVGLEAHLFRRAPQRALTCGRPGFAQRVGNDGCARATPSRALNELTQLVAFASPGDNGWSDRLFRELLLPPWTVLADSAVAHAHGAHCRHHGHEHPGGEGAHAGEPLLPSPLWWRLASEDHPAHHLPCGCC